MRRFVILAFALALAGCATITKGTTQTVAVDTPGVPGATCTIQTQSGTNEFHGRLFEYFRNQLLNSNDWLNNALGVPRQAFHQLLKRSNTSGGRERIRNHNLCVIARLCSHKGRCLQRALQRARDYEIELHPKRVEIAADKNALLLALLVERALYVDNRIRASRSGACVAKNIKIHKITSGRRSFYLIVTSD